MRGVTTRLSAAVTALCWLGACDNRPTPAGPDVVLITVDTLRADRLGFAGHAGAATPVMDALAARGRVFTQATTPLPRTTPALASLLTGLAPARHGSIEVGTPIHPHLTSLATRLHAAGWHTVAVSGSAVAGPEHGLDRGFDRFDLMEDPPAVDLTRQALARVAALDADRPVLLWVHYTDPHFPYAPHASADNPPAPACAALGTSASTGKLKRWRIFGDTGGHASAALADCRLLYDAEVAHVDVAIGQLLEGLGERADGLVVLTADHGENMGEGGIWYEHGPDADDASVRVPLIFAGHTIEPGADNAVARLEDVAPTVLAALGLTALPGADGLDLGQPTRPAFAVIQSGSALHARLAVTLRAGRTDGRHCLHAPRYSLCNNGFYDRQDDPAMRTDLTGQRLNIEAAMATDAARWPAEQARQHAVRSTRWKLVATPQQNGGYSERLYPVTPTGLTGAEVALSVVPDDVLANLRGGLPDAVRAGLATDAPAAGRDAQATDALRALGYVE